ncbi:MAG TPA: SIMPL domain-containing protein [Gemmatimonadaceae bacterium]|nr:SIMPL domain-containing protein [Gemmatimonadaceae bacterium]
MMRYSTIWACLALASCSPTAAGQGSAWLEGEQVVADGVARRTGGVRDAALTFVVVDSGPSREAARRLVRTRVDRLLLAMGQLGLPPSAVRRADLARLLVPAEEARTTRRLVETGRPAPGVIDYDWRPATDVVSRDAVEVVVPDGALVERVVAAARRAGASRVSRRTVAPDSSPEAERALAAALTKARDAATELARWHGGRLGRLLSSAPVDPPSQLPPQLVHIDSFARLHVVGVPMGRADTVVARGRWEFVGPPRDERDAVAILQGVDSALRIRPAQVQAVARALRAARRAYPQLADIQPQERSAWLVVAIRDSAAPTIVRVSTRDRDAPTDTEWLVPLRRVGVTRIDSLNTAFGVTRVSRDRDGLNLHMRLPDDPLLNLPALAERYMRLPEVMGAFGDPWFDGGYTYVRLFDKGARLLLQFDRGGGDCPAGCTEWDHYYVAYDTASGRAVLEASRLHAERDRWPRMPILHWDSPSRRSADAYESIEELWRGLQDPRWWHRHHAVDVLELLLGAQTEPLFGGGAQSRSRFAALKRQALARRSEAYERLIGRLDDSDPDVAKRAHQVLRALAGREHPGGAAGVARWREWLRAQSWGGPRQP